jgi:DegV family protein with EDD domain
MKTAIITDSGANLTESFLEKHDNVFMIPLMIMIDGKAYRDQVDITSEEVYAKLDDHKVTTSLPSLDDLTETLNTIKEAGYTHVLALNLSSNLSGTFNAFRLVFEEEKDLKITHYDSKTLGGGLSILVEDAVHLLEKGVSLEEIIVHLNQLRYKDSLAIYTIDTLKYLKRGGRIGKVEGTIGNILRVKPIITVDDEGVYETLSKTWGLQRALLQMKTMLKDMFQDDQIDLIVHYGDDADKAQSLSDKLQAELNVRNVSLVKLTPVLGVHTGPALFAYIAKRV